MRFSRAVVGLAAAVLFLDPALGAPPAPSTKVIAPVESITLRSIGGWLKGHGADGYVGADVADALGIPRAEGQDLLDAKQRGFRNGDVLRIAQISADAKRDF